MTNPNGSINGASQSSFHLKVIIVGGGTAGLSTAWRLARSGHHVTVLERKDALNIGGGHIQISPNGIKLVRRLGLEYYLKPVSQEKNDIFVRGWHSMEVLNKFPIDPTGEYPSRMFRREDLVRACYKAALEAGATVLFGKAVVSIDEQKPSVTLSDGHEMAADLIIGADGVKSTIRSLLYQDTEPVITDQVCFYFTVPYETMSKDPDLASLYVDGRNGFEVHQGPGRYITAWALEPRQEYFCITSELSSKAPVDITSWETDPKNLQELRELYKDWPEPWRKLMAVATECAKWRIVDGVRGADWVSKSGNVVLIGDAIHAMPPHAAQGASQGLEDMAALGEVVDSIKSQNDLPEAMKSFGEFRCLRTTNTQQGARSNIVAFTLPDGPEQQARDTMWKNRKFDDSAVEAWNRAELDPDAGVTDPSYQKWVTSYDVIEEAKRHIYQLSKQTP